MSRSTRYTNLASDTKAENTSKRKTLEHPSRDLPENLAKYANDHFNKFIPEKYLQESILVENPVSLSLHPPRKMDEFMRDLIFEKIAGILEEAADSNLVKMQQKLLEVMEPLSKVWTTVNSYFEQKWKSHYLKFSQIYTKL